jgi:hypothetical protein
VPSAIRRVSVVQDAKIDFAGELADPTMAQAFSTMLALRVTPLEESILCPGIDRAHVGCGYYNSNTINGDSGIISSGGPPRLVK